MSIEDEDAASEEGSQAPVSPGNASKANLKQSSFPAAAPVLTTSSSDRSPMKSFKTRAEAIRNAAKNERKTSLQMEKLPSSRQVSMPTTATNTAPISKKFNKKKETLNPLNRVSVSLIEAV